MNTGMKCVQFAGIVVLCLGTAFADNTPPPKHPHKSKKTQPQLPPLNVGPTGPIQQIPLDSMSPVTPRVTYENGQLTIDAPNSTLGDVLRAVRKQTGAEIDVPDAKERVAMTIGPGPAQQIMAELLNGSRFNYILLGSPEDPKALTKIVLVARSPSDMANRSMAPQPPAEQAANADPNQADTSSDANDAENAQAAEDSSPEQAVDQPAAADADQPSQPGVKTPQQLLQEMQQRQLQLQQQQNPGLNQQASPQQPPTPQQQ